MGIGAQFFTELSFPRSKVHLGQPRIKRRHRSRDSPRGFRRPNEGARDYGGVRPFRGQGEFGQPLRLTVFEWTVSAAL